MAGNGLGREGFGNQLDEDMFLFDYPKGFDLDRFQIKPYRTRLMEDGYTFDLGNRSLQVIHTPGHSNDSIMLFDGGNKILFTGDTFYLGALYCHFDCKEFGKSDIRDYYRTMKGLPERCPGVTALYCSHNDFIAEPSKIEEAASALETIMNSFVQRAGPVKAAHTYLEDGQKLKEFQFEGFSIIVTDEQENGDDQ
jgi:glyoxylase-like metal-dependent hydrolase (beta-lactamase superfamily II)